jgi:hypothetical protein
MCIVTITAMSESPISYVKKMIMFFYNCRFKTPETKKNTSSRIRT